MTMYVLKLISLLGGLALFLFGMDIMGKALERQAGGKLQVILARMSSTVFRGLFLGLAVTAVIQSSSATTVMVVGFVNSGIMTLRQAVGVIMGANIGTTVTSWILSLTALEGDSLMIQIFKPSTLAPLLGIIGIILYMFTKSERKKGIGTILLGFMGLMTGMELMSDAMTFLKDEAWFADMMISFSNPIVGIAVGTILTAVIQSSSASVGILQSLCSTGVVTGGTDIPIILGQNIGTCVTALISTVGANRNARRTAMVHLYFNMMGVAIFALLFYGIGAFFPWHFLTETISEFDIALIHTGFNVLTTMVMLPLHNVLEKLAAISVRDDEKKPEEVTLLDERLLGTPAVAVQRAREIASDMGDKAARAMTLAVGLRSRFDPRILEQVKSLEDETDTYEDALGTYLVQLTGQRLSQDDNRTLNTLLYTISDLERIADYAVSVAKAGEEISRKNIHFSEAARQELSVLEEATLDVIRHTMDAFRTGDLGQAAKVEPREQVADHRVKEIKPRHIRRLRDDQCTVEYGFVLEDLLTACKRSADHCSNVAVEMLQVAEDKLEAHEYLNALKSGELDESAKFAERLEKYEARYNFPEETGRK